MIKLKYSKDAQIWGGTVINFVEIKNKLGNGCTNPFVAWCDDGKTYIVKFPGNKQGTKALVNEYIASNLCKYLKLPIFDYSLINVKISDYNENTKNEIIPLEGTAFGTVYNDNALTILNARMISKSSNRHDAIKILIFDLLIGNYDRNKGNLMIDSVSKKMFMIDHTHIFGLGTIWDEVQLPRLMNEEFEISTLDQFNYNNIIESIKFDDEFYCELNKFIIRVKNINKKFINNIMNSIPSDWLVSDKEKKLLVEYIYNRFNRIDEILNLLDIKGGDNDEI